MPRFYYEIINAKGDLQEGTLDAPNSQALADKFHQQGATVISIAPTGGKEGAKKPSANLKKEKTSSAGNKSKTAIPWYKGNLSLTGTGSVKLADLLLFTSQLSSMVGAGLHLLNILNSLAQDTKDRALKAILGAVKNDVEEGESLSTAMAKHPKAFTGIYISLVRAAEATGNLDIILEQLAIYLEKTIGLRRKVKSAMTYPGVVLTIAMLAVIGILVKIVPQFERTYNSLNAELPAPTLLMISISHLLIDYFFLSMVALGVFLFILNRLINTKHGRIIFDTILIKIPGFGPLIFKSIITRFLRTLSILLESGVNVLEALELAAETSGNKVIERAVLKCIDEIREGKGISEAFIKTKVFPDMVIRMISAGEEAGTLPEMLMKVTVYYEQQVETAVEGLSSIIEPLLMVFLGVVIGSVVVAVFLPIFNLGEAVKKGMH